MHQKSVGNQFYHQLQELRKRIDSTTPHYIRCLKPNNDLVPDRFEPHIIADQLRCAGVLEAIRVSRIGFPHRFSHSDFLERYKGFQRSTVKSYFIEKDQCQHLIQDLTPEIVKVVHRQHDGEKSIDVHK